MFTVLKNLSNLLVIGGDYVFFGRTYGTAVWACVFLMLASAAAGGLTDVKFSWEGYTWQLINCVFTSGSVGGAPASGWLTGCVALWAAERHGYSPS